MGAKRDALPSLLPPFAVALFEIFWLTELRRLKQANETVEKLSQSHSLLLLLACHSNLKRRQKKEEEEECSLPVTKLAIPSYCLYCGGGGTFFVLLIFPSPIVFCLSLTYFHC